MNEAYVAVLISFITAAATIVGAYLTVRAARRKNEADATDTLTKIALSLVEPLQTKLAEMQTELQRVEGEVDALKKENAQLHKWAQLLFSQVVEHGGEPYSFDWVAERFPDG